MRYCSIGKEGSDFGIQRRDSGWKRDCATVGVFAFPLTRMTKPLSQLCKTEEKSLGVMVLTPKFASRYKTQIANERDPAFLFGGEREPRIPT